MSKKAKEFVRGFDVAASVFKALVNAIVDAGGTDEDVRRIETNSGLRKQIAELVVLGKKAANGILRLAVDYSQSLPEMIKGGRFDYVNSDITEKNFPVNRRTNGEVEMRIFHFNRTISSKEAIQEMNDQGYRPAELPEGLAYAKANPDEQRKYPIILLGSVSVYRDWFGDRFVPFLLELGGRRGLDLVWFEGGWRGGYRFLAVRK